MDNLAPSHSASAVRDAVAEAQALAKEQIAAAWQLQADRIREQLESGWRDSLDRIFDERFGEVSGRLEEGFRTAVESASREALGRELSASRRAGRAELAERLNQTARRMKQAEGRDVWIRAFLERAADFCGRAAVFAVRGRTLSYEGGLGVDDGGGQGSGDVPLSGAPAFASAVETKDTVVSVATSRELSGPVARLFGGEAPQRKVWLFPFSHQGQVVGVLYADPGPDGVDVNGLELLAAIAETTIEPQAPSQRPPEGFVRITGVSPTPPPPPVAGWAGLPRADQDLHARAERFARTQVAQIMLYKMRDVRAGRAAKDLYGALKGDIDAAREAYRNEYVNPARNLPDYFHAELVRTLAQEDAELLGPGYPGPLA